VALFSRTGLGRAEIDAAVAVAAICELPSARGCTYVVSSDDFGLALSVARLCGQDAEFRLAERHIGVTLSEIEALEEAVVSAVSGQALDPSEIKEAVGGSARSLGEAGKKRGLSSTLPIALGRLQVRGRIRRIPADGRLDRQRYKYTAWGLPMPDWSLEEALARLAAAYWRWAGPASVAQFQKFAGITAKAAKVAVSALDLVLIGSGELMILGDEAAAYERFETPAEPAYALVASLDPALLHRWELAPLLDDADLGRETATDKGTVRIAEVQDLWSNAILDRGRLVGLWEYDPFAAEIVAVSFVGYPPALREAIARTEAFLRDELGDCRSFSLDSPESRKPKLATLREMAAS
jgi:hypothetical protein